MMNGRANQLTEMVPVERIYSELGRYITAGATHYLLVNASDIRPVSMTIRAVMDIAWKGRPRAKIRRPPVSTAAGPRDQIRAEGAAQKIADV